MRTGVQRLDFLSPPLALYKPPSSSSNPNPFPLLEPPLLETPFCSFLSSPPPKLVDTLGFERERPDLHFHKTDLCSSQDFFIVDFVTLGALDPRRLGVCPGIFLACG